MAYYTYNIVKDYDWTSVPRNSPLRDEAPVAIVVAHELANTQLQQFINGYLNTVVDNSDKDADEGIAFYKGLYSEAKKLDTYFFPYFNDSVRNFSSEFTNSFTTISQRGAKMLGGESIEGFAGAAEGLIGGGIELGKGIWNTAGSLVKGAVEGVKAEKGQGGKAMFTAAMKETKEAMGKMTVGDPGTYIETPKFYQYGNTDQGVQVQFILSNTLDDDAPQKNAEFIKHFTTINRPVRLGSLGMTFPAIYHVEIPGLRYIEWAYQSEFSVGLIGQRRKINDVIIPEAWSVGMTFTSLTMEPANFMQKVEVPTEPVATVERDKAIAALRAKLVENPESQSYTPGTETQQFRQPVA